MEEVGLDARIIKVASLGLDEKWLGKNVADYRTRMALDNLKKRWGSGNVAGEGGEFETLVMGCRGWSKRVEVIKSETVNEDCEVYWTRFLDTKVVDVTEPGQLSLPPKPPILDDEFRRILHQVEEPKVSMPPISNTNLPKPPAPFHTTIERSPNNIYIANLHNELGNIAEQVTSIFTQLRQHLQEASANEKQITSTLLLLRSMSDFHSVNKAYSPFFSTFPNPPSRVCISIGEAMPSRIDVLLSTMVDIPPTEDRRKALHVQSRSYWAPANVGPYSQAIATSGIVTIAGMIGLVPHTMKVWEAEGIKGEIALSLQSMIRVGREMNIHGTKGWLGGVGYVIDPSYVKTMKQIWLAWFQGDYAAEDDSMNGETIDPDLNNQMELQGYFEKSDEDITPPKQRKLNSRVPPPLLILHVAQLPIGSNVEFACLGLDSAFIRGKAAAGKSDDEESDLSKQNWDLGNSVSESLDGNLIWSSFKIGPHLLVWGALKGNINDFATSVKKIQTEEYSPISLTIYLDPQTWEHTNNLTAKLTDAGFSGVACLPVFNISWTAHEEDAESSGYSVGFALRATRTS
ncbi:hypothetical protein TWF694_000803 [Orbilia ellipsospora]|uniref:Diphthamide synthase domain-containing protein n=1 Tax=Orbilia ellipsospora TaxID=2528407 RepID=A0AAV9XR71_9PEZI